jgi:hypothetical protein
MVFDSNLRQEQTPLRVEHDEQTVTPDLNRFRGYRGRWGKQRDFDREIAELIRPHRRKSRIFQGGAGGAANNGVSQRLFRLNHSNAALQALANVKRHENPAAFCE